MILVDANILLYAEDTLSDRHHAAREWWDQQLSGRDPVCLCWPALTAFVRIGTNARLHQRRPLSLSEAIERVQSWLNQPCTRLITPTEHHWSIFQRMLRQGNASANLVSDAHLAALAVEHGCELASTDTDFARFSDLDWVNPLSAPE
jgi:toxin-antitoxin system PIN domain toxin